ncbi:alpha/beta hydrolase [Allosphingosinicella indica]|nr:alpha/beta hydrolase [Allosphingosinicella indica]
MSLLSGLMVIGALVHLAQTRQVAAKYPPPGRFVDVGGHRVHILAEGEARGRPTLVWFAGGHTGGYAIHNLHRRMVGQFRSILIDRPGTGWSDVGTFPRTTAKEADEMWAALDAAGEKGPFVLVGHSFGGLLSANMARRHPERVKALILLDATPPDTIVYGPVLGALGDMRRDALFGGLLGLFAIDYEKLKGTPPPPPPVAKLLATIDRELGAPGEAVRELEKSPAAHMASYSIYRELSPAGLASVAWNTVVYDGDLSPLPVFLVAPGDLKEFGTLNEAANAEQREAMRMQRFFAATRERYLATSVNSERVVAPEGTGHNFPYEAPAFVVATVARAALQ